MKQVVCEGCGNRLGPGETTLCGVCRVWGFPEQVYFEKIMQQTRRRAHEDKKTLEMFAELPYVERLKAMRARGILIYYPPVQEQDQ